MKPLISARDLSLVYQKDAQSTRVLDEVDIEIHQGEMVAIQGPSGSGKSTLLYILGCLLQPTGGVIEIAGQDVSTLSGDELAKLRSQSLGFVFQQFHLLPKTDILDNVLMPAQYSERNFEEAPRDRALKLIRALGLEDRVGHFPNQLSGGQQQRVAIARALINDPDIILADEPTGNLDSKTSKQILDLLRELNSKWHKTVVIITHDHEVASLCDRVLFMKDGKIQSSGSVEKQQRDLVVRPKSKSTRPILSHLTPFLAIQNFLPMAIRSLNRNRVRSTLTMLGVSVGIAAVLVLVTLGQFTKNRILAGYADLGVNTILFHGNRNWEQKATDLVPVSFQSFEWNRDLQPLKQLFPQIRRIAPILMGWKSAATFGGRIVDSDVRIIGTNSESLHITNRKMLYGRNFSPDEVDRKSSVCIIGFEIGQRLFSNLNPIGQALRLTLEDSPLGCNVIGVLESTTSNQDWMKPNLQIFIPYTIFQGLRIDWASDIRRVLIQLEADSEIETTGGAIRTLFEQKYGPSGRFRVDSDSLLLAQMERFLNLFTVLLGSIAFVTLGVGGVGITNMMLVSVSERFREIGIRKAVGATDQAIRFQFLSEAVVICLLAGLLGLGVGFFLYEGAIWGASKFSSKLTFEWIFDEVALVLSFVSILAVGLLSGLFPALKAQNLQVIEALRSE